mgnify:CR=1 FL=1
MSRIGKQPVSVPDSVEITIEPELVRVKGPKGELEERVSEVWQALEREANAHATTSAVS